MAGRKISSQDQTFDSVFASAPSNALLGSGTMVNFGGVGGVNGSGKALFQSSDQEEYGDEYLDDYFNQPEKKKRLSVDQVQFLERCFEAENKLEPERKVQLANELGLQPRQISVWFQNRRARWKTKQLETDYDKLHATYKSLKTDYEHLLKENDKLKAEVLRLKYSGRGSDIEKVAETKRPRDDEDSKVPTMVFVTEGQRSGKDDDVSNGIKPFLLETGDSSHVFEPNLTDNGEDRLNQESLRHAYIFSKNEDASFHPHANSCSYGFPTEDHASNFWSY